LRISPTDSIAATYDQCMRRSIFTDDHELFRQSVRTFIEREVTPNFERWDRDGIVDRELFTAAGATGFLGIDAPEQFGGGGVEFAVVNDAERVVTTIERMGALLRSMPTEMVRLDLASVVRSALLYQRPRLWNRGIQLETAGLEEGWLVWGDGGQLQIALNNLIDNANEAMGERPVPGARITG